MASSSCRVTSQNQISVPADVRRRFGIRPGTVLEWLDVDGELHVRPKRLSLDEVRAEMRAMVRARRVSLEGLTLARVTAVVERYRRGSR